MNLVSDGLYHMFCWHGSVLIFKNLEFTVCLMGHAYAYSHSTKSPTRTLKDSKRPSTPLTDRLQTKLQQCPPEPSD
ncbi:unnamed protein product [Citrullus colocynthis]|uniref:Uncharacterized protein n=1 Tax=Citrullus colocynthis TaxID=252529 RepID=A0ABP0YBL7_9ROSI